jgi:cation diffusion facilitator CzcD-associated flavoprotein CzcO
MTRTTSMTDVAIIGAGPYGLAVAANLRYQGVEHRIFGTPMRTWRENMPEGMYLKSEGFASNLPDPSGRYMLSHYCADHNIDWSAPISLDTFIGYGDWFQQNLVPSVEDIQVTEVKQSEDGFQLQLADGEAVTARRLVVATGLTYFTYVPPSLANLPADVLTHSAQHHDLRPFRGREVAVIGGGQSALETATLMHEQGAHVHVLVRKPRVLWNETPDPHPSLLHRIRYPVAGLGAGWPGWFYEHFPMGPYYFPHRTRVRLARESYGPAGAWWLKDRALNRFPIIAGTTIESISVTPEGSHVNVRWQDQRQGTLRVDHVIAATGFRVNLDRLTFLSRDLRAQVRRLQGAPLLSRHFQSSVPGLYFVGFPSAYSFGPLMRFVLGTGFTGPTLARHLAGQTTQARRYAQAGAGVPA